MEKEWVLSIRDQCERARIPFFFKQWGGVRKSKAGRELDGTTYDGLPVRSQLPVMEHAKRLEAIAEFETFVPTCQGDTRGFAFPGVEEHPVLSAAHCR